MRAHAIRTQCLGSKTPENWTGTTFWVDESKTNNYRKSRQQYLYVWLGMRCGTAVSNSAYLKTMTLHIEYYVEIMEKLLLNVELLFFGNVFVTKNNIFHPDFFSWQGMIILHRKTTPALSLFDLSRIGPGQRPRTLEFCQVVTLFRERLHLRLVFPLEM